MCGVDSDAVNFGESLVKEGMTYGLIDSDIHWQLILILVIHDQLQ